MKKWYHAEMEDCIFCQIVAKKLSSYHIYEDQNFVAFLDVFPREKGHVLVIPKAHLRWVVDVPNFGEYWEVAKKIGLAVQKATNADFISFLTHGLDVPHAHIHILPRKITESGFVPDVTKLSTDTMAEVAESIRQSLQ